MRARLVKRCLMLNTELSAEGAAIAGLEPVAVFRAGFPFSNLHRLTVILPGKGLIAAVVADDDGAATSRLAIAAVARVPDGGRATKA